MTVIFNNKAPSISLGNTREVEGATFFVRRGTTVFLQYQDSSIPTQTGTDRIRVELQV